MKSFLNKDNLSSLRRRLHEVIFESDTPAGRAFDVALILCILLSVAVVMLDSVAHLRKDYGLVLNVIEWGLTIIFTIEFLLRLYCVGRPLRYAFSFYGVIDFFSILPTYIGLFVPGANAVSVVRILRVCRIFRVLKFTMYLGEAEMLAHSLVASRRKITVFLSAVLSVVVILGAIMYILEGSHPGSGFTSIPKSVYWAIVTLTTVGYGDISPQTPLGQGIASMIMILGYSIIAIPTGIVTAEMVRNSVQDDMNGRACPECLLEGHAVDAVYCKKCGVKLNP